MMDTITATINQYRLQHAEAVRLMTECQQQALRLEGAIAALDQLLLASQPTATEPEGTGVKAGGPAEG